MHPTPRGSFGFVLVVVAFALTATRAHADDASPDARPAHVDSDDPEHLPDEGPRDAQDPAPSFMGEPARGKSQEGETTDATSTVADAPAPSAQSSSPASSLVEESGLFDSLDAEFGRGVTLRSADDRFSLTVRGRVQLRAVLRTTGDDEVPVDAFFQVRRARVAFTGQLFRTDLQFYVQLGFAPADMEPDLLVPLRDAVLTWTPFRDLGMRMGQMKVPFNRQRMISSSALQFPDRSIVNAELTLDRDIGIQLFSNDLLGLGGFLEYQIGVFGGDGRNRLNRGVGLLYVARLQVQPLGRFNDVYSESDLARTRTPRVSIGTGIAYNDDARRAQSTHGFFYQEASYDELHGELDFLLKWWGFSLQSELIFRQALTPPSAPALASGLASELPRSGVGFFVQGGYLLPLDLELAARVAIIEPFVVDALRAAPTSMPRSREFGAGLGWYILGHNLKLQADVLHAFSDDVFDATQTLRVQMQIFF